MLKASVCLLCVRDSTSVIISGYVSSFELVKMNIPHVVLGELLVDMDAYLCDEITVVLI